MDKLGCRFVSRLKSYTELKDVTELPVPEQVPDILSDRIGLLKRRISRGRPNPMTDPVREITVRTAKGQDIRVVTNDLDAPAQEIADLKQRESTLSLGAADLLTKVLEQVSEECRRLWQMLFAGLSYREMSETLGVKAGALRVRVLRCRKRAVEVRDELSGT